MSIAQLSVVFFLQMFIILLVCRVVGWIGRKYLHQPQVVGEMVAGVILGPSLFGLLLPELQKAVFPVETKGVLYVGAQLGVGLYMFLVGLGFRADHFKTNVKSAAAVSISGMAAPFLVAILITPWLMSVPGLFSESATRFNATLFMGACIAITAFPMLARIIHERGLSQTKLGTLSLSAGAIDDAGAWCVLAIVLASFGAGAGVAYTAIIGGILFASFMILVAPKLLAPLARYAEGQQTLSPTLLSIVLMLFMLSAFIADAIGLHAVFGGFLLGAIMPRGKLTNEVKRQLEPFVVILLLPMFFTYSGLNTQLTMVNNLELLAIALVILAGSIAAKGVACWGAARLCGADNRTAMGIGALMNARGLMELIIINIGLQAGVIGPALFSMMVLMAIVTTLMASPLFEVVYGKRAREMGELEALSKDEQSHQPTPQTTSPT
ncbi:cation:proton antiporter [Cellvibrio japonicus]|uniref:Cation:proton antiporter n=1 Tax=Cellvibrio japonicus (strain Ueda107) TaxID=498211 RepID=B3PDU9_CELJU|nr:cation:proton antiporter [Cellvibrio japonicus]ACE84243.1 cation:proton antiporter [Cellvibrio japonicus Ueda107]QEI13436.1 cation:proton antiporter [Cellvibrio japonicus]QEI17010.1 cation:proton antiporter [Cellvibrio japonicus]QEI20588.1 cation:proton antiporter [Cellvibrio japonicus]